MSGLIGRKIGMTSIFDENGKNIPCTVIEAGPCVSLPKSEPKRSTGTMPFNLVSMTRQRKVLHKAEIGHAKKAGTSVKAKVAEFQGFEGDYKLGDAITVEHFIRR